MLLLTSSTDKIQVVTDAAVTVDVHASYMDYNGSTITPGRTNTAISTQATTDVVAAPAASTQRNVKVLNIRNTHTTSSVNITVQHVASGGTAVQLFKCSLLAGEHLIFADEVGWQHFDSNGNLVVGTSIRFERRLRVNTTQIVSGTGMTDITDLSTATLSSGKKYSFESVIFYSSDATTTGPAFSVNGPTMTDLQFGNIFVVTNSVTAASFGTGCATTRDTAAATGTTGVGPANTGMSILSGSFLTSNSGTFAVRFASEAAVLTAAKLGSWLRLWEVDN